MSNSLKNFYERYWMLGAPTRRFSGSRARYANNFRTWMAANLEGMPKTDPMLEVGCGDASFTGDLARFSDQVSAVDISEEQIAINQEKYPEIRFLAHDLSEPLPFPSNLFRAIWCSEVLEHLFDPAFAIREIQRVLQPGGLVLLTVPFHGGLKNLCIALFKWDHHFDPEYPHLRFFTKNTLSRLCAKAGLTEIRMTTCGMNRPLRDLFIPTNLLLRATKPQ